MGLVSRSFSFSTMYFFYVLISAFNLILNANSQSSPRNILCRDHERSALLQFKRSLSVDPSASTQLFPETKIESWKLDRGENTDCCSWDGVQCNGVTGRVIGLDLSSSSLYGSINSSSSLFSLGHLQRLNLADNDFSYSEIPSGISRLLRLTHLDLSNSVFSGSIPKAVLKLSRLVSLDLSVNLDRETSDGLLELDGLVFRSLPQSLPNLKNLVLNFVHVNSTVPETFANMSALTVLSLRGCGLSGDFPKSIFLLPNLQSLLLWSNADLTGSLPEFNQRNRLKELDIGRTGFSGVLPASLANLTQLTSLIMEFIDFSEEDLSPLAKLKNLSELTLASTNLQGEIPSYFANLTNLMLLSLEKNALTGQLPSWLFNLTQLASLDLSFNELQGPIPRSFSKLKNLELLALHNNNFSGTVETNIFLSLKKLTQLNLAGNKLSLLISNTTPATVNLPKFQLLALPSCNLSEFPDFLRFQDELQVLSLADNVIDHLPEWMWNGSREIHENISGFDRHPLLPWPKLRIFDLSDNFLEGSIPIPPPTTAFYSVSNNMLSGEISPSICSLTSLSVLDLSSNGMSGEIPACLGNFSDSLTVINLKGNSFQGTIPQAFNIDNNLKMIDLSQNQLEGKLPRSLANCTNLQILDLGNNQLVDTFPFWLESVSELQVLILSSNKLHGVLEAPTYNLPFPKLRIIDLSNNFFTGYLPLKYIQAWTGMKMETLDVAYMKFSATFDVLDQPWEGSYLYSIMLTNKGVKIQYEKVLNIYTSVDLSRNKFEGELPEHIGSLIGLQSLNLSNNELTGGIPFSLGNLSQLESLDLSRNKLSGEIPQQLAQLNFLAFLNVSSNRLDGAIPVGKQFNTFQNNSYEGNLALCGEPLALKCGHSEGPSSFQKGEDFDFLGGVDLMVLFIGVGSGLAVGLIFGTHLSTKHHEWFVEKFGKWPKKWQSVSFFENGERKIKHSVVS